MSKCCDNPKLQAVLEIQADISRVRWGEGEEPNHFELSPTNNTLFVICTNCKTIIRYVNEIQMDDFETAN